jgi:hypothetical protein
MATELIRGKTAEEALNMDGTALSAPLGPLPPMKIHCAQLVEGALKNALAGVPTSAQPPAPEKADSKRGESHLYASFAQSSEPEKRPTIKFLPK